jgi:hypothetical protein
MLRIEVQKFRSRAPFRSHTDNAAVIKKLKMIFPDSFTRMKQTDQTVIGFRVKRGDVWPLLQITM